MLQASAAANLAELDPPKATACASLPAPTLTSIANRLRPVLQASSAANLAELDPEKAARKAAKLAEKEAKKVGS